MDNATVLRAGSMLEALFLEPMLRPMLAGVDALGEYELDLLAREIAERDTRGFGALIAARMAQTQ